MRQMLIIIPILLINISPFTTGFKFLGLFPLPIRSNFLMYETIFKGLADRGHEIDVLSHYPQKTPVKNINDIDISGSIPSLDNNVSIESVSKMTRIESAWSVFRTHGVDVCEKVLQHRALQILRKSKKKYDGILIEVFGTDCLLGFSHLYKAPVIGITSSMHLPWADERMGNPDNPSYVSNYFIPFNKNMTIGQKIELATATVLSKIGYHLISTIPSEMRARDFFGTDLPPLDQLAFNMSLLLVNSYFGLSDPRPTVPGLIEVGGLHIQNPKNLTPELATLAKSANGIIYFSMGTVVKLSSFDNQKLQSLLHVLSQLPYTVLFKGNVQDLRSFKPTDNIHFSEWFPQIDILCHSKTKLFITPGGQMSIQEAAFCGVPIVGIPFLPHQVLNVQFFESKGAGIGIEYDDIDEFKIKRAIKTITDNNTYHKNAKALARVYNDRPLSPLQTALFWIEYVIRHKGAFHLRTKSVDLIWMDYYLLDVAFIFTIIFIVLLYLMVKLLHFLQDYFDYSKLQIKSNGKVSTHNNVKATQ
ncbi:UDP-glucuronosyltransferase 2B30-like [Agrilus planipennis]|uniref:UDP-glucuronosyltransferase 2B30-like n=1 Tax=Agrilus planipennis TaxID=224129 RepID=A0A1W4X720_AGRPL|nr:UDP-glucuronosyltransferase 2B30-like [Agrilus planipennis]XP_025831161.1 UDP-glucuronosyltransferase 2B30-like [Agrilus planipennis]